MNRAIPGQPAEMQHKSREGLWPAVAVSLSLHGAAAVALYLLGMNSWEATVSRPAVVSIKLYPAEALKTAPPESSVPVAEPQLVSPPVATAETPEQVFSPATAQPANEIETPAPNAETVSSSRPIVELPAVSEVVGPAQTVAERSPPPVSAPTVMAIRQTINSQSGQQQLDAWKVDCNPLTELHPLFDCERESDGDISNPRSRLVYQSLNPVSPLNSGRQTQALLGRNRSELTERLATISSRSGVSNDYLVEEIEAGLGVYASDGNAPLQRLQDQMHANDPTYQLVKSVLGPQ